MKLLLVEDDQALQQSLCRTLQKRHFEMISCTDGAMACALWQYHLPDVVLLDLSLPHQDGLEVLSEARRLGLQTPVILLTARGTVGDRVLGLNAGADDYLAKPFDLDELEARIRAVVRRRTSTEDANKTQPKHELELSHLQIAKDSGMAYWRGLPFELPPRELALLRTLLQQKGQAVAKERVFEQVFAGEKEVQLEALDVLAYRLRKHLQETDVQLVTLRGLGYMLKVATPNARPLTA